MKKISWTQYSSYMLNRKVAAGGDAERCTLQHYLKYIERVRVEKDRTVFAVGSAVHEAVKGWTLDPRDDYFKEHLLRHLRHELADCAPQHPAALQKMVQKAAQGAMRTKQMYQELNLLEHGAEFELPFEVPFQDDPEYFIEGIVDIYDPVTHTILDLKVSLNAMGDRRQTLVYTAGLTKTGRQVENVGFVYPLIDKPIVTTPVSAEEVYTLECDMLRAIKEIDAGYEPKAVANPKCMWCEYKGKVQCPVTYYTEPIIQDDGFIALGG